MNNSDFNDQHKARGLEDVQDAILSAIKNLHAPLDKPPAEKKIAWSLREVLQMERPEMLVQSLIATRSQAAITGPTASWKSFFAIELGLCVALGVPFFGFQVIKGGVLIIAGEGVYGLQARFKALRIRRGLPDFPENLYIRNGVNLLDSDDLTWIKQFIEDNDIKLVIIDTLARNFIGDENSAKDLGAAIANIDRHIIEAGATCITVHHTGHGAQDRARGSSVFRAALDTEIGFERVGDGVRVKCWKSKDFAPFEDMTFNTEVVSTMDIDEYGQPITSLVLQPCKIYKQAQLTAAENRMWAVLQKTGTPFTAEDAKTLVREDLGKIRNLGQVLISVQNLPGFWGKQR